MDNVHNGNVWQSPLQALGWSQRLWLLAHQKGCGTSWANKIVVGIVMHLHWKIFQGTLCAIPRNLKLLLRQIDNQLRQVTSISEFGIQTLDTKLFERLWSLFRVMKLQPRGPTTTRQLSELSFAARISHPLAKSWKELQNDFQIGSESVAKTSNLISSHLEVVICLPSIELS